MGNPHAVFFVPDAESIDLARLGPIWNTIPCFRNAAISRSFSRSVPDGCACGSGSAAPASRRPAAPVPAPVSSPHRAAACRPVADVVLDGGTLSIEWLKDDHVLMTGPVALSYSGTPRQQLAAMTTVPTKTALQTEEPVEGPDVMTFGCRLNAYESEVMRDHARAAGWQDAVIVNTCAVTKEGRASSPSGHPQIAPRTAPCQDRRHRLRRPDRSAEVRRHAGGRPGHRQCREDAGHQLITRQHRAHRRHRTSWPSAKPPNI